MDGIIEIAREQVFSYAGATPVQQIILEEGHGRGIVGRADAPSFAETMLSLDQLIAEGKIKEGDLKVRFESSQVADTGRGKNLTLRFGPTMFYECKGDMDLPKAEMSRLHQKGLAEHNDEGFYLARGTGVVVLPRTVEKQIPVGVRRSTEYDGEVHGTAAWLEFHRDVAKIDPLARAFWRLGRELGIQRDDVAAIELLGAVAYPNTLEVDLIYVAQLNSNKPAAYFKSGAWKQAVDSRDHKELLLPSSPDELLRLANEGKPPQDDRKMKIIASTRYGLETIAMYMP